MKIRRAEDADNEQLVRLIAEFRVGLAGLRGKDASPDLAAPAAELDGYRRRQFPIFVAEGEPGLAGYLVCRVDENTVWAESLFVRPEHRRKGVASMLYAEAERLADELGSHTVYNWIHPDNDAIVGFLRKRGYDVLNLVEVRRARPGETLSRELLVGRHRFGY